MRLVTIVEATEKPFLIHASRVYMICATFQTWKKTKQYWVDWSPKYEVWKDAFKQIEGRNSNASRLHPYTVNKVVLSL